MASLYGSPPADSAHPEPASHLIGGEFAVDFSRPLLGGAGGRSAFAASGGQGRLANFMAVQVTRGWPLRVQTIHALSTTPIQNLMVPLGDGPARLPNGDTGYFVVSAAPPGRPLSESMQSWSEKDLIDQVLRPVAEVLGKMQGLGVTHRAIRPDNVFLVADRAPVTLGCAWEAPAACRQPAVCEPPYSAVCDPASHGEGTIADDVYALGVLLVWLALGRDPMAGLDTESIIQRKLDVGSYAAVLGQNRLPPFIADLVRGMLADDPEHRPSPALLSDPTAARARRTATRIATRPQRSFELGGISAWTPRALAHAMLRNPAAGLEPLRNGTIDYWLRRVMGDSALAARLDEAIEEPPSAGVRGERYRDARRIMKAVAILDPLAPLTWRGAVFWPDGLGPALNNAVQTPLGSARIEALVEVAGSEVLESWLSARPGKLDQRSMQMLMREHQKWLNSKPVESGPLRLCYALNPLAPCDSPMLAHDWTIRLPDLLPAMEAVIASARCEQSAIDRHLVAFIAVRRDERIDREVGVALGMMSTADPQSPLRLLAACQAATPAMAAPHLAGWIAAGLGANTLRYQSQSRRQRLTTQLSVAVQQGNLSAMIAILADPVEAVLDAEGRLAAMKRMKAIDQALATLATGVSDRQRAGKHLGHDVAGVAALLACGIALASVVLS